MKTRGVSWACLLVGVIVFPLGSLAQQHANKWSEKVSSAADSQSFSSHSQATKQVGGKEDLRAETGTVLVAILSSSLLSACISAAISGWISLRTKQREYENEYFKIVLNRRLEAYGEVERLVAMLKTAVLDNDNRPYHFLFSNEEGRTEIYGLFLGLSSRALWLTDDLFSATRELNLLVFNQTRDNQGLVDFGKENYKTISELRSKLEKLYARDMLSLHRVPAFIAAKRPTDSYTPIPRNAGALG